MESQPTEQKLIVSDGFGIASRLWRPSGAKKIKNAVLCIHGIGLYSGIFRSLAPLLAEDGSVVYAIDLRGFGNSVEPNLARGDVSSFTRYLQDVGDIVSEIRKANDGVKLFILGHSLGGALTVWYAANHPGDIDGFILLAPAVKAYTKLSIRQLLWFGLASVFAPRSFFDVDSTFPGFRETEDYKVLSSDKLVTGRTSVRYLFNSTRKLISKSLDHGAMVQEPVLILQGERDLHVRPDGARMLREVMHKSRDTRLEFFSDANHFFYGVLLPENVSDYKLDGRERLVETISNWLDEHSQAK